MRQPNWIHRLDGVPRSALEALAASASLRAEGVARAALAAARGTDSEAREVSLERIDAEDGAMEPEPLDPGAPAVVLGWPGRPTPITLELDARSARDLVARSTGGAPPLTAPLTDLELGLVSAALAESLERRAPPVFVADAWPSLREVIPPIEPRLTSTWRSEETRARLRVPLSLAETLPPAHPAFPLGRLPPVELAIVIGEVVVPASRLASLSPGDVLLPSSSPARIVVLPGRHVLFNARWHDRPSGGSALEILEIPETVMTEPPAPSVPLIPADEPTVVHGPSAAGRLLEHVMVPVTVVLVRLRVPAAQLATWAPGQVIPLERGPDEPVLLELPSGRLGEARLVDVEGRLGCRVVELEPDLR